MTQLQCSVSIINLISYISFAELSRADMVYGSFWIGNILKPAFNLSIMSPMNGKYGTPHTYALVILCYAFHFIALNKVRETLF